MPSTMRFEGGAQLQKALSGLAPSLQGSVLRQGLTEAAEPMRASMAQRAPRAPGKPDIADNIVISRVTKIDGDRLTDTEHAVGVGPAKGFFWGWFLEMGTAKMSAQPFVRPAFDEHYQGALSSLAGFVWRVLIGRGAGSAWSTSGGNL